jgi:hypothetical protein
MHALFQVKYSYIHGELTSLSIIPIPIIPTVPRMLLRLPGISWVKPHLFCLPRRLWGRRPDLANDGFMVVIFLLLDNGLTLVVRCRAGADGGVMRVVDGGGGGLALEIHVVGCVG